VDRIVNWAFTSIGIPYVPVEQPALGPYALGDRVDVSVLIDPSFFGTTNPDRGTVLASSLSLNGGVIGINDEPVIGHNELATNDEMVTGGIDTEFSTDDNALAYGGYLAAFADALTVVSNGNDTPFIITMVDDDATFYPDDSVAARAEMPGIERFGEFDRASLWISHEDPVLGTHWIFVEDIEFEAVPVPAPASALVLGGLLVARRRREGC